MKPPLITYRPTQRDIDEYWDRGYWISAKLIDDQTIAHMRSALDRLFEGKRDGDGWYFEDPPASQPDFALKRVVNAWWVNDAVHALVTDPGLGRIAGALMKADAVRLWADQALSKPGSGPNATDAANIGWHQDYSYWHISSTDNMVTAWIALQDTDLSNGGMRTLARSHKWGLIEGSDKFYNPDLDALRGYFDEKINGEWIDEPCILKAGQASFHHSLTFHGSGENRTDQPRMSVVGHYMPDGTTYRPSGRTMRFLRLLGPRPQAGIPFGDPAFPLVYSHDSQRADTGAKRAVR